MNAEMSAEPMNDPATLPVAPGPLPAGIRFIGAGAGSGKTHRLTALLHERIRAGTVRPSAVMAMSFTRRAAQALRERVAARLLAGGDGGLATAFAAAHIGTVNSLCAALLARHAWSAGLPPQQRVLDEASADRLLGAAIDGVLQDEALVRLDRLATRLGIDDWSGAPLRGLIALARSNGLDAAALAACGRRCADDLLEAWPAPDATLPAALAAALAAAIPAARARLDALAKPVRSSERYLETLRRLARDAAAEGGAPWAQWLRVLNEDCGRRLDAPLAPLHALVQRLGAHPALQADLRAWLTQGYALAAAALDDYQRRKAEAGYVDFVDQERLTLDLLQRPGLRAQLAGELDLLLVDEFQDTSPLQLALLLALAGCARETVWVGDPKQAIYGFRGCDPALVRSLLAQLHGAGHAHERLTQSWRTRPALVGLVNAVFAPAFAADGLEAADVHLQAQRGEPPQPAAALHGWTLPGRGTEPFAALAAGLQALCSGSARVQDAGGGPWRAPCWGDIAILARQHATLARLAPVLRAAGIPVALGEPGLLEQPELRLALAVLRRFLDAGDTLASAEILTLAEGRPVEDWLPGRLDWLDAGLPSARWGEQGEGAQPLLAHIASLREAGTALLLAPAAALQWLLAETGVDVRVSAWCAGHDEAAARLANLDRLLELASEYEAQCATLDRPASLSGLPGWLQARAAAGEDRTAASQTGTAVQLLTLHAAKGLEWPVVVLCELDAELKAGPWGRWAQGGADFDARAPLAQRTLHDWPWPCAPLRKAAPLDFVEALPAAAARRATVEAEARRLLYVGFTRARDVLVLARAASVAAAPAGAFATLGAPWLWAAPGTTRLALPGGGEIDCCFTSPRPGATAPVAVAPAAPGFWSRPLLTDAPGERPAQRVSPSAAAGVPCRSGEPECFGDPLPMRGAPAPEALGRALHLCLAASCTDPAAPLTVAEIAAILDAHGLAAALDAEAVSQRIAALQGWIRRRWPGRRPCAEWPVEQRLAGGQVLHGRIDLLLEGPHDHVLIDHKTSAAPPAAWPGLAASHAGQLAAYAQAIERASGRPVSECWLHFPVAGGAIRLEFQPA